MKTRVYECKNVVTFRSTGAVLEKIKNYLQGEEGVFDFNSIKPIPEEIRDLELFAIGKENFYYSRLRYDQCGLEHGYKLTDEWVKQNCLDPFTIRRLTREHTYLSRHDWCVQNWGMMLNTHEASYTYNEALEQPDDNYGHNVGKCSELVYTFETVWSEPQHIYDLLYLYTKMFNMPVHFEWYFEDSVQDYKGYMEPSEHIRNCPVN